MKKSEVKVVRFAARRIHGIAALVSICLIVTLSAVYGVSGPQTSSGSVSPAYNTQSPPDSQPGFLTIAEPENELVVLIHGFCRTKRDMYPLQTFLESRGYHVFCPTLPTAFGSLETCTLKFEEEFRELNGQYDRVHFVGHSMGGLIIRLFLSRNDVPGLGRCILIGTPNNGTELAALADRYCKPFMWIFKPCRSFQPGRVEIPPPLNSPPPEMGAIAGNGSGLFLGRFITGENDGRVPVDSVPFSGMKELIVLPFNHVEIHHRPETAELVIWFLRDGTFQGNNR
ncbi:alpha/beta fold hydrolase [bacterium]|nr:alpha/beta fold hydrolase [bacterium]